MLVFFKKDRKKSSLSCNPENQDSDNLFPTNPENQDSDADNYPINHDTDSKNSNFYLNCISLNLKYDKENNYSFIIGDKYTAFCPK
jgi:hypothetical protein